MAAYRDLFDVHLKYVDYVRAKSYVVHQYVQNVAVSGSGVEVEVRAILRSMLPERFELLMGTSHALLIALRSRQFHPRLMF